jgi:hypothetical protein
LLNKPCTLYDSFGKKIAAGILNSLQTSWSAPSAAGMYYMEVDGFVQRLVVE